MTTCRTGPLRLPLLDSRPAGEPIGAVIVLQEALGVDGHVRGVAERLAVAGYHAVAPHLFHRTGDPQGLTVDDLPTVLPHLKAVDRQGLTADLKATLEYLAEAGHQERDVALLGFSMGASATIVLASQWALGAAVSYCPGGLTAGRLFGVPPLVEMARGLRTPWLGLFADADPGVPGPDVEALRSTASTSSVPTEVVRYPGARHSFYCRGHTAEYDEAYEADAWRRTLAHMGRHLGSPGGGLLTG